MRFVARSVARGRAAAIRDVRPRGTGILPPRSCRRDRAVDFLVLEAAHAGAGSGEVRRRLPAHGLMEE